MVACEWLFFVFCTDVCPNLTIFKRSKTWGIQLDIPTLLTTTSSILEVIFNHDPTASTWAPGCSMIWINFCCRPFARKSSMIKPYLMDPKFTCTERCHHLLGKGIKPQPSRCPHSSWCFSPFSKDHGNIQGFSYIKGQVHPDASWSRLSSRRILEPVSPTTSFKEFKTNLVGQSDPPWGYSHLKHFIFKMRSFQQFHTLLLLLKSSTIFTNKKAQGKSLKSLERENDPGLLIRCSGTL